MAGRKPGKTRKTAQKKNVVNPRRAKQHPGPPRKRAEKAMQERTRDLSKVNESLLNEISERKDAEKVLQRERDLLQSVMNGAKNSHLVYLDRNFNFVRVNETYAATCGYRPEEMIGKNHFALYPNAENEAIFARVRDTGEAFEIHDKPFEFPDQPGRGVTYWDWTLTPVKDPAGYVEGLIFSLHETTARKRAEEALRATSERYRSYVDVTGQLGWATNAEGEAVEDMPSWRNFTGKTFDELRGWGWLKALHPDDRAKVTQAWEKAVAVRNKYEIEYRIRRHDGIYRYFMARGIPVFNEEGGIREWVGTCIDITERRKAEESLKTTHAELEHRAYELLAVNRQLEAFSYTVSHDLKAPLRSIDGFTKALLEDYTDKLDATGKDYLQRVNAATMRMNQLVDAMLNMARLTRGELHEKTVDLSSLVQTAAHDLQKQDPHRQVKFLIAEQVKARADQDMLMIVLQNLLDNSWKFTSRHPDATIEFGVKKMNGKTIYFVRDDGAGFDMQYAENLFMPFTRYHSELVFPGLGIGLAIADRIIMRHGGRMWAEAEVEKGATFFFTLGG